MLAVGDSSRTVRVRFDGDPKGLETASARAERAVGRVDRVVGRLQTTAANMASRFTVGFATKAATIIPVAAAAGAAAGGALVLAFGGALAGIGLVAAAHSAKVQASFTDLRTHVVTELKRISTPFEQTLLDISAQSRRTFDAFAPDLEKANQKLAPAVSKFTDQLFSAFEKLAPAIQPMTDAFVVLLNDLGPQLPGIFSTIATALIGLANAVKENPKPLADMITLAGTLIGVVITLIGWIVRIQGVFTSLRDTLTGVVAGAFRYVTGVFLGFVGAILDGAARAFGWVPELGDKLRNAAAEFNTFRDNVNRSLSGINDKTITVRAITTGIGAGTTPGGGGRALQHRAGGGSVAGGRTYRVNELGPELLTVAGRDYLMMGERSGTVTPTSQLAGGDTHVYVTIDGQQLEGRIDRVVRERDRGVKRSVLAGAR